MKRSPWIYFFLGSSAHAAATTALMESGIVNVTSIGQGVWAFVVLLVCVVATESVH